MTFCFIANKDIAFSKLCFASLVYPIKKWAASVSLKQQWLILLLFVYTFHICLATPPNYFHFPVTNQKRKHLRFEYNIGLHVQTHFSQYSSSVVSSVATRFKFSKGKFQWRNGFLAVSNGNRKLESKRNRLYLKQMHQYRLTKRAEQSQETSHALKNKTFASA